MEILIASVLGILIAGLGFYVMHKIDIFRRERSRQKGFPMDEED